MDDPKPKRLISICVSQEEEVAITNFLQKSARHDTNKSPQKYVFETTSGRPLVRGTVKDLLNATLLETPVKNPAL